VFTMLMVRYAIVLPNYDKAGLPPGLNHTMFFILVASVVLISAAGYIINDYFDVKADEINKPEKIIVGRQIERRWVMFAQILINFVGLVLGYLCAKTINRPHLVSYHIFAICLLWYYSAHLKKKLIIGNIVVALLTALVCWIVVAFEWYKLSVNTFGNSISNQMVIYGFIYAMFAFLVNLKREIIKDAEDMDGDIVLNSNTIPLKYGLKATRNIVITLAAFSTLLISFFIIFNFQAQYNYRPIKLLALLLVGIPFLLVSIKTFKADTKSAYHQISNWLKIIMFFGILSMFFL